LRPRQATAKSQFGLVCCRPTCRPGCWQPPLDGAQAALRSSRNDDDNRQDRKQDDELYHLGSPTNPFGLADCYPPIGFAGVTMLTSSVYFLQKRARGAELGPRSRMRHACKHRRCPGHSNGRPSGFRRAHPLGSPPATSSERRGPRVRRWHKGDDPNGCPPRTDRCRRGHRLNGARARRVACSRN